MKISHKVMLFSLLTFFTLSTIAGPAGKNDTTAVLHKDTIDNGAIVNNLDSVLNLWYVSQNQYDTSGGVPLEEGVEGEVINGYFADSVVKERMKRLNAGSPIDFEYNHQVRSFLNLYGIRKRDQVERMLGLAQHYFPIFEKELDKKGLPLELKYLPVIESALNPNATSRMGASGIWQFMFATGKQYGLDVTSYVDERRDVEKSTKVAVEYLDDLYGIYENWLLVIAAYNCGPGNVNKAIRRSGYKDQFWKVYPFLPRETRGYVPAFIAASYVFHYQEAHNLYPRATQMPLATDTVWVKRNLSFKALAKSLNVTEEALEIMNPQFKKGLIPGGSQPYVLKLPFQQSMKFVSKLDTIYALQDSLEKASEPEEKQASNSRGEKSNSSYQVVKYKVKSGDNLGYIAEWFNCRASDLRRWNNMRGSRIHEGQNLRVYVPSDKVAYYKKFNSLSFSEKQARSREGNQGTSSATTNEEAPTYYTVKSGDTLWDIARKFEGVSLDQLKELNNIRNGRGLKAGQKIRTQ